MRRLPTIALFVALLAAPTAAACLDLSPEKLKAFRLDGSALLKGFVRTADDSPAIAPSSANPLGAEAAQNGRWFHGATELRTLVIRFRSDADLRKYVSDVLRTRSARVVTSPPSAIVPSIVSWRSTAADRREMQRRMPMDPNEQMKLVREFAGRHPTAVCASTIVGRHLIEVWVCQHPEAARRDPATFRRRLPDGRIVSLATAVAQELAGRATAHAR